jgi:hypothetical protein
MKRKDRATAAPLNVYALLCSIIRVIHLLKEATGLVEVFTSWAVGFRNRTWASFFTSHG